MNFQKVDIWYFVYELVVDLERVGGRCIVTRRFVSIGEWDWVGRYGIGEWGCSCRYAGHSFYYRLTFLLLLIV